MRKFKFDLDIFVKNCENVGATITKGSGKITLNGEAFDIQNEIMKALTDPSVFDSEPANVKVTIEGEIMTNESQYLSTDINLLAA